MLSKHGLAVPEPILQQLDDAPLAWKQLKKKMFQRCATSEARRMIASNDRRPALHIPVSRGLEGKQGALLTSQSRVPHLQAGDHSAAADSRGGGDPEGI